LCGADTHAGGQLGQFWPMDPVTVCPGSVAPTNWDTPSTTTANGPAGTWTETRMGT